MNLSLSKPVDMGSGSIPRVVLALAIPAMMSMFFQNLYAFIDTMFISWLGTVPLAAQALSIPIFYVALSLGKGVQVGTAALISRTRGENNLEKVEALAGAALPLLLLAILPIFLLLVPGISDTFFGLMGAKGEMLAQVYSYTFWLVLGFPVMAYVMVAEAIFMSHGDTFTPMKAMLLGNGANLILAPLLMFALDFGIAGASMAMLLGQILSAIYIRARLKQSGLFVPTVKRQSEIIKTWKEIGRLGAFVALTFLISPVSLTLINGVLASFGAAPVAAWNIMSRLEMLGLLPLNGMAASMIPFLSFNLGQYKYQRIKDGIKFFFVVAVIFVLPMMTIFILLPQYLMFPFRASTEVMELGKHAIRIAAFGHILAPIELALYSLAQGLQKPWYPMFTLGMRVIVLRYTLALYLGAHWGAFGIFWCQPSSMALGAIISSVMLWKLMQRVEAM
ncbi:MAG: MATE family efflux transporter [Syntrophomonas sp.]|nr:MATE family efflux transporter [Syntrophomonas sp.]